MTLKMIATELGPLDMKNLKSTVAKVVMVIIAL